MASSFERLYLVPSTSLSVCGWKLRYTHLNRNDKSWWIRRGKVADPISLFQWINNWLIRILHQDLQFRSAAFSENRNFYCFLSIVPYSCSTARWLVRFLEHSGHFASAARPEAYWITAQRLAWVFEKQKQFQKFVMERGDSNWEGSTEWEQLMSPE